MNSTTTTESATCVLHQLERNRYFYGKLMTVRDFETEQRYVREHRHLHNQSLHGWGVVCGLTVVPKGGVGNATKVVVQPGVALDCCGREIVVAQEQELDLANFLNIGTVDATGKTVYLCIRYHDCKREPVPALSNVSTCEPVCDYNRIQEGATFDILTALPMPIPSEACATWMNLTVVRSDIEDGGIVVGEFERTVPRWVRQGDVFEVRRKIIPTVTGRAIHVIDTLPAGFTLVDGTLEMGVTPSVEGKVIHSTYLVEVGGTVTPTTGYAITGLALMSPPDPLATSTLEVISSAEQLDAHLQRAWFTQEFQECPRCAEAEPGHCVLLASIALQQQGTSFIITPTSAAIDNVIFDAARGIHRQLVYPMPLVVQLLECLQHDPRLSDAREPLPHAITHQDGGTDEINVTNLSGVLADTQKVEIQDEGNPVGTPRRLNFTGVGVTASSDALDPERVNIQIPGVAVSNDNVQILPAVSTLNFAGGLDAVDGSQGQANISANVGNGLQIVGDQIQPDYATTPTPGRVCEANDPRLSDARVPLPHAVTHQNGGVDGINVTDLPGVLAEAQRVTVQDEGNPVATRTELNFIGPGVSVSDDVANDRINITIPGGAAARIFTGEVAVVFDGNGNLIPLTVEVRELLVEEPFAVMLAPQLPPTIPPVLFPPLNQRQGVHFVFGSPPDDPRRIFVAFVPQPYNRIFEIHGFARQLANQRINVVCWVIAGAQQVAIRPVPPGRIIDFIRNNPNITLAGLAEGLEIERDTLEPEIARLIEESIVRRGPGGRLTLVEP